MKLILQTNLVINQPYDLDTVEDLLMVEAVRNDGGLVMCSTGGSDIFVPLQRVGTLFPRGGKVRFVSAAPQCSLVVYAP